MPTKPARTSPFNPTFFYLLALGGASGLPFPLSDSTLKAYLQEQKIDIAIIGAFSLVGLPYTLKFLWAPLVDRLTFSFLDRRRSWAVVMQICLALSIGLIGIFPPENSLWAIGTLALLISLFSATQDIALDAYRRDILSDRELGLGAAFFVNGYRLGILFSGAGALYMASYLPWRVVFFALGGLLLLSTLFTAASPKVPGEIAPPQSWREAVISPFLEFMERNGRKTFFILAFVLFFKLGDNLASSLTTPFILGHGYTKQELATFVKTFGVLANILGGFAGGFVLLRLGINRSLLLFGIYQMVSTIFFAGLAAMGHNLGFLSLTIFLEYSSGGMGTSAFAAYLARLCNKRFTASQYALLTSWMGVPRVLIASTSGILVGHLGWVMFFVLCTAAALPGLLLIPQVAPWQVREAN